MKIILASLIISASLFANAGVVRAGSKVIMQIFGKVPTGVVRSVGKTRLMNSMRGLNKYEAGLLKAATAIKFRNGKVWFQNDRLLKNTPENIRKMSRGEAPLGTDGKPIELHHLKQKNDGIIVEMLASEHRNRKHHKDLHGYCSSNCSQINRRAFDKERINYWMNRAVDLQF